MKKKLPSLREVRNDTVWRTFERLGYYYKARRRKAAVAEKHKPARLAYCDWVEKQDQEDLDDWSYVDGTSIYLATHEAQHLDKQRGSLGRSVWRLTDGSDSLEDKNVGGSSYAKSQGKPVKIWGCAMASRHALLHVHASLDPNVAIRFILGWVKLCTIV